MASRNASRDLKAIIGGNVRVARETAGLTQNELAQQLGPKLANQTVSDWERGVNRPSDENLLRLCAVLGRDVAWFYTEDDDAPVAA